MAFSTFESPKPSGLERSPTQPTFKVWAAAAADVDEDAGADEAVVVAPVGAVVEAGAVTVVEVGATALVVVVDPPQPAKQAAAARMATKATATIT